MPRFHTGRRRYRAHGGHRLHPLAIVGICLAATVLLAVIIGNLLNLWLDDETYKRLTEGEETQVQEPAPQPVRKVPRACVYPFVLGSATDSLVSGSAPAPSALSVSLNTPQGDLLYTSPVAVHQGKAPTSAAELSDAMLSVRAVVPYISGIFYPQALNEGSADLVYAVTVEEAALLREFAATGASEILLVGLPLDAENRETALFYIKQIKDALPASVSLGISVPFSTARQSPELLAVLQQSLDYLALDLQDTAELTAEKALFAANYYLVQHDMRLLLSSAQTELIGHAEATLSDFQILQAPPAQEPPAENTPEPVG